jgi:Winged helix DNA-binding domain
VDGRELWDLPDGPVPDADSPAPPRFLPEYDNALLGYADRRRVMADGMTFAKYARRLRPRSVVRGGVLIGGFLGGVWSITREADGGHVLVVEPFKSPASADASELEKLSHRLLAFVAGDGATGRVELR